MHAARLALQLLLTAVCLQLMRSIIGMGPRKTNYVDGNIQAVRN